MSRELTVLVEHGELYFIASVIGLPGCFTQGETVDVLKVHVYEAVAAYLDIENPDVKFIWVKCLREDKHEQCFEN